MPPVNGAVERRMSLSEVKQQFSKVVNEVACGESTVIVEKHRHPVVVIVSYHDYQSFLRREELRAAKSGIGNVASQ